MNNKQSMNLLKENRYMYDSWNFHTLKPHTFSHKQCFEYFFQEVDVRVRLADHSSLK